MFEVFFLEKKVCVRVPLVCFERRCNGRDGLQNCYWHTTARHQRIFDSSRAGICTIHRQRQEGNISNKSDTDAYSRCTPITSLGVFLKDLSHSYLFVNGAYFSGQSAIVDAAVR